MSPGRGGRAASAVLLSAVVLLTGCGSADDTDGSSAGTPETTDTCELLTDEDLTTVFGSPDSGRKPLNAGPYAGCEFSVADAPFYLYAGVLDASSTSGRTEFEAERKGRKKPEDLTGIGTGAFSSTTSDQTDVVFYLENQMVTISLIYWDSRTGDPADDVATVSGLAKKAADRL